MNFNTQLMMSKLLNQDSLQTCSSDLKEIIQVKKVKFFKILQIVRNVWRIENKLKTQLWNDFSPSLCSLCSILDLVAFSAYFGDIQTIIKDSVEFLILGQGGLVFSTHGQGQLRGQLNFRQRWGEDHRLSRADILEFPLKIRGGMYFAQLRSKIQTGSLSDVHK